jgi:hypothetical protein
MGTFDREICFCKEKMKDGTYRIRQLGWEFVDGKISQRPIATGLDSGTVLNIADMLFDPSYNYDIDQVTNIEYYDSEVDLTNRFDNVTAMYSGNGDNVSGEMGYPRT